MTHDNYYEVEADTYYEMGEQLGDLFADDLHLALGWCQDNDKDWAAKRHKATAYMGHAAKHFPHLINELRGYADAADADLADVWLLCMEEELDEDEPEKCTTFVTNHGSLIAHNEDWDVDSKDDICLLKKTIKDLTIFELFYYNTLGGNSISINSHGYVHAINTLTHNDYHVGIPRNVIARWMSETSAPDDDIREMATLPRSAGYHHTLVAPDGRLWSVETSATKQALLRPTTPFVHTNHFLTKLQHLDADDGSCGSISRYHRAQSMVKEQMSLDEAKAIMGDTSDGPTQSVFNQHTIARLLFDLKDMQLHAWLLSEAEKGWISYDLDWLR